MKEKIGFIILMMVSGLTVSCSALSPARLFEPLEWEGQWAEIDATVLDSYPVGNGYSVTYEAEVNENSEIENCLGLWENGERKGKMISHPSSRSFIDGFMQEGFLLLTYIKFGGGVTFAKINSTTLTEDFAVDILPSGTPSIDVISFPTEDGFILVWGTINEQSWLFLDTSGTLNETQTTTFALSSFESTDNSYQTFGSSTLKVGDTTYLNFSGNLLSFDGMTPSLIASPTVLGFPDNSDVLSYYYANTAGNSFESDFLLYLVTGTETEPVVSIDKKYLRKTDLGISFFFKNHSVFVLGMRYFALNNQYPVMLIYNGETNLTYWSEFYYRDHAIYEPFDLIGDYFYYFGDQTVGIPSDYWRAQIPSVA